MITIKTISETRGIIRNVKALGKKIGFVPTMGALHEGHLELLRRAGEKDDFIVSSIFVNPLQFNISTDLEKYPRMLAEDQSKLDSVGCHLLFAPTVEEMYPEEVSESFDFGHLDKVMEGKFRPGHFNGVAVVVKRLFEIVEPDHAYFGEKDFQQLTIIREMVRMQQMPVEIVAVPTVREPDGLAMSSRNLRLSPVEREAAPFIYHMLMEARDQAGKLSPGILRRDITAKFSENGMFRLEYFDIVRISDLLPVQRWDESPDIIACVAAWLGNVRLIDNMILFRNFAPAKL